MESFGFWREGWGIIIGERYDDSDEYVVDERSYLYLVLLSCRLLD